MTAADLPVGGSTGLDHIDAGRVEIAAWYVATTPPGAQPRPLPAVLKRMFGLTCAEVEEAIAEARLIQARAI